MTDNSDWQKIEGNYHYLDTPTLQFICGFIENGCYSVFEAGCGSGSLPNILQKRGNYKGGYVGSDYTDAFLKMAKKNLPDHAFMKANLLEHIDLIDNSFDCCVALDVFDNVYPYENGFKELRRISKKYVIITLWQEFINHNIIKFNEEGKWGVNTYDKKEWYDTLEKIGYKIIVDADIHQFVPQLYKKERLYHQHLFILDVNKK